MMIDNMISWAGAFPGFSGMEILLDALPWRHGCVGLFPKGLTELGRKEDILGGVRLRKRFSVTVAVCLPKAAGDSAPENAALLHSFARWAEENAPTLGENQVCRAQAGQLKADHRLGLGRYELRLSWEYDE